MHFDEGTLQSYLDNQLSYEENGVIEEHLKECIECQRKLELLAGEDELISAELRMYQKAASLYEVNAASKWHDFEKFLQQEQQEASLESPAVTTPEILNSEIREKRSWNIMNKSWQRWVAGAAAVAVVCGVFTFSPVQATAARLLKIFRVEKIETVKMTPEDFREIAEKIENKVGTVDLRSLGKVEVLKTSTYDRINMDEAEERGYEAPGWLPAGASAMGVDFTTGEKLKFILDVDKVNELIEQLGGNTLLPEGIRDKAFTLETFDTLSCSYDLAGGRSLRITQTRSPELEVEAEIDTQQLMKSLWDFPFLPEDMKNRLKQVSSLENTLVVPELEGELERIKINGVTVLRTLPQDNSSVTMEISEDGNEKMIVNGKEVRVRMNPDGYSGSVSYLWIHEEKLFIVEGSGLTPPEAEKIVESLI